MKKVEFVKIGAGSYTPPMTEVLGLVSEDVFATSTFGTVPGAEEDEPYNF